MNNTEALQKLNEVIQLLHNILLILRPRIGKEQDCCHCIYWERLRADASIIWGLCKYPRSEYTGTATPAKDFVCEYFTLATEGKGKE